MSFTHRVYYQRTRRRNGRRFTEYFGIGCEDIAATHAAERRARLEARQEYLRVEAKHQALGDVEAALGKLLDDAVTLELARAGYARLGRGPWRWRSSMKRIDKPEMTPEERGKVADEIATAAIAARTGDKGALAKLRELGAAHPEAVILATIGDPATLARTALLNHFERHPGTQEGVEIKLDQLAKELAGPDPSPARRLVAQAASFAHSEFWLLQMAATQKDWSTPAQIRRLDSAHARYLKATRTLVAIAQLERRRPRPIRATQINIGVVPAAASPEPEAPALTDF
jgi:hypothetical protein